MGVQTSEVGYTTAMPRREDHEVHKDMWWHLIKKNSVIILTIVLQFPAVFSTVTRCTVFVA
jgi:hypothetical protein